MTPPQFTRRRLSAALALTLGASLAPVHGASNAPAAGAQPSVSAPVAAPSLPVLSVAQIVERNVAARGGLAAWRSVHSISYAGTLDAGHVRPDNGLNPASNERLIDKSGRSFKAAQSPDEQAAAADTGVDVTLPYALYMERPNKQRIEVRFQDETLVQVFDGHQGWKLQPYLHRGGALPFSADEMKKAEQFQDIDGPLVDYQAKGTRIALDGTDLVDGHPAYRIKLTLKNGDARRVWIDGQSFLDVQIDGTRRMNGRQVAIYTTLRDFRAVNGLQVPYTMETRTDGIPAREKILVEKVALNPHLDDALFRKPR